MQVTVFCGQDSTDPLHVRMEGDSVHELVVFPGNTVNFSGLRASRLLVLAANPAPSTYVEGTYAVRPTNMGPKLFGTGYLQYDLGPAPITVTVRDGLGNILNTFAMEPGTSTTFTYRRLGSLQLSLPATDGDYQGEFCLTTRYAV